MSHLMLMHEQQKIFFTKISYPVDKLYTQIGIDGLPHKFLVHIELGTLFFQIQ